MVKEDIRAGRKHWGLQSVLAERALSLKVTLTLIALIGLGVRLLFIREPLQGDEYNSLQAAATWDTQINGWFYYVLLGLWMRLGTSDWWYRLPSILLGVAAVPLAFSVGAQVVNRRTGLVLAGFTAVSPYTVELSLQIRHYSLYLFASLFALSTTLYYLRKTQDRRRLVLLAISFLLVTLSHLFGIILVGSLMLYIYLHLGRWPSRVQQRAAFVGVLAAILLASLLWPAARDLGWEWVLEAIGALNRVDYQSPRGLSVAQFAKVGITFFVFALGYNVYPLQWEIVLPAFSLLSVSSVGGILLLRRVGRLLLPTILLALVLFVLLFLEPLVPPFTETVGPRHLALSWPAFALLVATGAAAIRRLPLIWLLLILSLYGVGSGLVGDWSYGLSGPDWRSASAFAESRLVPSTTVLVHDGRSAQPTARYFLKELPRTDLWSLGVDALPSDLLANSRVILTSADYKPENRRHFNDSLFQLEQSFSWVAGEVDYPLFTFVLEKAESAGYRVDATNGQIYQPLRLYGIEFQDLELPINMSVAGKQVEVLGAFFLPDLSDARHQAIPLATPILGSRFLILTNVLDSHALDTNVPIAELRIATTAGEIWKVPIRLSRETEDWSRECRSDVQCTTVYSWRKRVSLSGQRAYPDAWREFSARIHAATIRFPQPSKIERISIEYLADTGRLYVWGMAVLP